MFLEPGVWQILSWVLVAMVVVTELDSSSYHGKTTCPILFSCMAWAPLLATQSMLVQCNNLSLVENLAKGSSRDSKVMRLLRCLWFFVAFYDIELQATHIAGSLNCMITCQGIICNHSSPYPTGIASVSSLHPSMLQMVSLQELDWISHHFTDLFNDITHWAQHHPHGKHKIQGSTNTPNFAA